MYVACALLIAGIMLLPASYPYLLQILTFKNIYKFKLALFIHKIESDPTNIPAIFSGTLSTLTYEIHNYNTTFGTNERVVKKIESSRRNGKSNRGDFLIFVFLMLVKLSYMCSEMPAHLSE